MNRPDHLFYLLKFFFPCLYLILLAGRQEAAAGITCRHQTDTLLLTNLHADSVILRSFLPDTVWVSAQTPRIHMVLAEDSLKILAGRMMAATGDSARLSENERFIYYLKEILTADDSIMYPFDSLSTVSFLPSPDARFRIITWYVPLSGQRFSYFGLMQFAGLPHEKKTIVPLREVIDFIGEEEVGVFSASSWYGAYYYELISNTYQGEDQFILLGWRGDNQDTRKRIIEPLSVREGKPVFGAPVFDLDDGKPMRIIFEYSVRASMSLLYDRQLNSQGGERIPMIVFDRLEPMDTQYRGQKKFYVPEGNIFDAFVFKEGRWVPLYDVDARHYR